MMFSIFISPGGSVESLLDRTVSWYLRYLMPCPFPCPPRAERINPKTVGSEDDIQELPGNKVILEEVSWKVEGFPMSEEVCAMPPGANG